MKDQGKSSRMDESLGMRDGKESGKMQSYKSRRNESTGEMHKDSMNKKSFVGFKIEDNTMSGEVKFVSTTAANNG